MWRKLGREGQGSREMRQGKRSTLLTSSLEDLAARGAAVAVEEGDGNWAWDPSAVPSADPSSKGAPIRVPSPATCPLYCPHQAAGPMKLLIQPAGRTVPARSHPAPQPGPLGAPSPVPCPHTLPAAGTVAATAARRAFHGTAWWSSQSGSSALGWQLLITRYPLPSGRKWCHHHALLLQVEQLRGADLPESLNYSWGPTPCTLFPPASGTEPAWG